MKKWIPYIGFLGFFLINVIAGILLISGITDPIEYATPIGFAPLTYLDLLLLLTLNIPALIIIIIALKKTFNQKKNS
ncbi:MAG: hypothetical protein GF329_00555 [Candidatus Lokiarchaeota archaeon]|nr:hypothetical protein [Candidatus Lokiarchaeota archaeon]